MILDVIPIFLFIVILLLLFLMRKQLTSIETDQDGQDAVNSLREDISRSEQGIKDEVRSSQRTVSQTLTTQLQSTGEMLGSNLTELGRAQTRELENATKATHNLTQSNESRIENVRKTVDNRLQTMQESNERKLDEMRKTVDEQLQSTLENRLTESFNIVNNNLESVQKGLGEMQALASGVDNLQRVLTNVSVRGVWGEVQLGTILEQVLTPDQYKSKVQLRAGAEQVDYAVRFPGKDPNTYVWLPIDSKFPTADYERLVDAAKEADKEKEQTAIKALMRTVRREAKSISEKYISEPTTTEFAIIFLPTEGLYSEVLRQPGEVAELLQKHNIVVAGPTTLAAILISLRVGFKTLALQEHSGEIRSLLAAVKTEFGTYHNALQLTQKQLNFASNNLEEAGKRSQEIVNKLQRLEDLPPAEAAERLGLPETQLESVSNDE